MLKEWFLLTSTRLDDYWLCISWRQTDGCEPHGDRVPQFDKPCDADIPNEASGYCECFGGIKQNMKDCSKGEFRNCYEACSKGKFLTMSF